jgi:hypothetical protein
MPGGTKSGQSRKHSRQTRFTRLRSTAQPIFLVTTSPRREGAFEAHAVRATRKTKCALVARPTRDAVVLDADEDWMRWKSACFRTLRLRGNRLRRRRRDATWTVAAYFL